MKKSKQPSAVFAEMTLSAPLSRIKDTSHAQHILLEKSLPRPPFRGGITNEFMAIQSIEDSKILQKYFEKLEEPLTTQS